MKVKYVLIGLLVFAGGYAAAAIANQAKLAGDTSFEYAGYQVMSIGPDRMQVQLSLRIINKSSIAYQVVNQSYKVYVNNTHVADVSEWSATHVPAKGSATVTLLVDFNPKQMLGTLWTELITNAGNANIRLRGKVSFRAFSVLFGRMKVDETFQLKKFKLQ